MIHEYIFFHTYVIINFKCVFITPIIVCPSLIAGYTVFAGVRKDADNDHVLNACTAKLGADTCQQHIIPVILDVTQHSTVVDAVRQMRAFYHHHM